MPFFAKFRLQPPRAHLQARENYSEVLMRSPARIKAIEKIKKPCAVGWSSRPLSRLLIAPDRRYQGSNEPRYTPRKHSTKQIMAASERHATNISPANDPNSLISRSQAPS